MTAVGVCGVSDCSWGSWVLRVAWARKSAWQGHVKLPPCVIQIMASPVQGQSTRQDGQKPLAIAAGKGQPAIVIVDWTWHCVIVPWKPPFVVGLLLLTHHSLFAFCSFKIDWTRLNKPLSIIIQYLLSKRSWKHVCRCLRRHWWIDAYFVSSMKKASEAWDTTKRGQRLVRASMFPGERSVREDGWMTNGWSMMFHFFVCLL